MGVGRAETVVALTDGGHGLERVLRQGVSDAVVGVLDWWHLSEKLHDLGRLLHEPDTGAAKAWAKARETTLWAAGGTALVAELDRLGCPEGAAPAAAAKWAEVRNHVWKNRHRTAYPEYRARGLEALAKGRLLQPDGYRNFRTVARLMKKLQRPKARRLAPVPISPTAPEVAKRLAANRNAPQKARRHCLRCEKPFVSLHIGQRMCDGCREAA